MTAFLGWALSCGEELHPADALRAAPDIHDKLTIVTIGGRGYREHHTDFREFNWGNDPEAINFILQDTDTPLWQIPKPPTGF